MSVSELSDPDFPHLRREFLSFIQHLHAKHSFEVDPLKFAESINLAVSRGSKNLYASFNGQPILQYNSQEPPTRMRFSLWHEICHHLFQTADSGFQALLEEKYGRNTPLSAKLEEDICNEAAGTLLMPDRQLQESIQKYGFDPRSAVALSLVCSCSVEASLRRIADTFDIESWVFLAEADGTVVYSHTRTRFPIRTNGRIPADHVAREVLLYPGLLERRAPMPYPERTSRTPHRMMRAIAHNHRILGILVDRFPPHHDATLPGLFD